MANATVTPTPKRVQINITLTVPTSADALGLIDWADGLKAKYPDAMIETRVIDQGSRMLGIP